MTMTTAIVASSALTSGPGQPAGGAHQIAGLAPQHHHFEEHGAAGTAGRVLRPVAEPGELGRPVGASWRASSAVR